MTTRDQPETRRALRRVRAELQAERHAKDIERAREESSFNGLAVGVIVYAFTLGEFAVAGGATVILFLVLLMRAYVEREQRRRNARRGDGR